MRDKCAGCGTDNDKDFESPNDLQCVACYDIQREIEEEEAWEENK